VLQPLFFKHEVFFSKMTFSRQKLVRIKKNSTNQKKCQKAVFFVRIRIFFHYIFPILTDLICTFRKSRFEKEIYIITQNTQIGKYCFIHERGLDLILIAGSIKCLVQFGKTAQTPTVIGCVKYFQTLPSCCSWEP
jgi:hypothetical protein